MERPFEEAFDDEGGYKLTPLAAEGLTSPKEFRKALGEAFGDDGDSYMMIMRLIQGRERRELPRPDDNDVAVLLSDFTTVSTLATMYDMALRGLVYVDVEEADEGGEKEVAFAITPEGLEAIAKHGRLY